MKAVSPSSPRRRSDGARFLGPRHRPGQQSGGSPPCFLCHGLGDGCCGGRQSQFQQDTHRKNDSVATILRIAEYFVYETQRDAAPPLTVESAPNETVYVARRHGGLRKPADTLGQEEQWSPSAMSPSTPASPLPPFPGCQRASGLQRRQSPFRGGNVDGPSRVTSQPLCPAPRV